MEPKYRGIIYCYINVINGLKYIGLTINERSRRSCFNTKEKYSTILSSDILSKFDQARKEFGIKNFKYKRLVIITSVDKLKVINKLNELEVYFIDKYNTFNNGYNSTTGGNSGLLSSETKRKISESLKGRPMSDLTKEKLIFAGNQHSEETKDLISDKAKERYKDQTSHPMFGKHHSEESKLKNSESRKGKCTGKDNGKSRSVVQLDKNYNFVSKFYTIIEAEKITNIKRSGISRCCTGGYKISGGYIWMYEEEYKLWLENGIPTDSFKKDS